VSEVQEAVRWILESVEEDDHSLFSPSGAHRWMVCHGSMALESDYPNVGSEYADEGTVAHEVLKRCFLENCDAEVFVGVEATVRSLTRSGKVLSERTFTVDEEMAAFVQVTLDSVRRRTAGKTLLVEQRVWFTKTIGTADPQGGTSDIIMISADGEDVYVEDFKYGMGVKVYASEIVGWTDGEEVNGQREQIPILRGNKQMLSYALGVLETYSDLLGNFKRFHLRVHQPRLDWEDEFTVSVEHVIEHGREMGSARLKCAVASEIHAYARKDKIIAAEKDEGKRMEMLAEAVFTAHPDNLTPGQKQCMFCRAKATCPALRQFVSAQVMDDFEVLDDPNKTVLATPVVPAGERLGAAVGALDMIRDWCNAVEAEAERLVLNGMTVIGSDNLPMKVVEGKRGNRKWKDETMAESLLVGTLPPEKAYVKEIISPAAAEKLIGKGLKKAQREARWAPFAEIITQSPGKPTVALGSDPRPVYTGEAKADEFDNLDEGDPAS